MTFETQKEIITTALNKANTPIEWFEQIMDVAYAKGKSDLSNAIQYKIAKMLSGYLYPEEQERLENLLAFIGEDGDAD